MEYGKAHVTSYKGVGDTKMSKSTFNEPTYTPILQR